jgi:hypothetical protein
MKKLWLLGAGIVFCGVVSVLAQEPKESAPAEKSYIPDAKKAVLPPAARRRNEEWKERIRQRASGGLSDGTIQKEFWSHAQAIRKVPEMLLKQDILTLSNELLAKLPTDDVRTLVVAAEVFLRAGQPNRLAKVIPMLAKMPKTAYMGNPVSRMVSRKYFPEALLWFDAFLTPPSCFTEMKLFLAWMIQKDGRDVTEAWLRNKAAQEELLVPYGKTYWVKLYWGQMRQWGKLDTLVAQYKDLVQQSPSDMTTVQHYIYSRQRLPRGTRPSPDWMIKTLQLKHARDNYNVGKWFSGKNDPGALQFMERALSLPLTDYDRDLRNLYGWHTLGPDLGSKEAGRSLRDLTYNALADLYRKTRQPEKAKAMKEIILERRKKRKRQRSSHDYEELGKANSATAQDVEGQLLKEEATRKNSVTYWENRAKFYAGKGDSAKEEHAYQTGLKLPSGNRHGYLSNSYMVFLVKQKRYDQADAMCRRELSRSNVFVGYGIICDLDFVAGKKRGKVAWDDPLIWAWLEKACKGGPGSRARFLLKKLVKKSANFPALEKKMLELTSKPSSPDIQYAVGKIIYQRTKSAKAAELMKSAFARWSENCEPRLETVGGELSTLLRVRKDSAGLKAVAAKLEDESQQKLDPHWLTVAAVRAAKNGQIDQGMWHWKRKAAMDLGDLDQLDVLAKTKLRPALEAFYRERAKKDLGNVAIAQALKTLQEKK